MFLKPFLESKIVFIIISFLFYGFSFYTLISFIVMIIADFLLRMITAGFTFKYKTFPAGVSQKSQDRAYWFSMAIILAVAFIINS